MSAIITCLAYADMWGHVLADAQKSVIVCAALATAGLAAVVTTAVLNNVCALSVPDNVAHDARHGYLQTIGQQPQMPPILKFAPGLASNETLTTHSQGRALDSSLCENSRLISFRYDFGSGGLGDCFKGLVAVLQIAMLLGRPFVIDFSRHPFARAVPLRQELIAPSCLQKLQDNDARVFNFVDWLSSKNRRASRDKAFAAIKQRSLDLSGVVMLTNINHTRELAEHVGFDVEQLRNSELFFFASMYSLVIDGPALRTYWPKEGADARRAYRVGIHFRYGDRHVADASFNKNDDRLGDGLEDLIAALREIITLSLIRADGRSVLFFVCADTASGRKMLVDHLGNVSIITSPWDPIHVGYDGTSGRRDIVDETRNVLREHFTLSTSDELYMATHSGFSKIACLTSASADTRPKLCYLRKGRRWELES